MGSETSYKSVQLMFALKFSLYWIYFLHPGFLSNLRLPWKTECALNSLADCIFFIIQDFWATCACTEEQSCPENFYCFEIFFFIQEFWATCACPENRVCPEIFHWIETVFIIQEFWATCACPENRTRRLVRLWYSRGWKHYTLYCLENDNFKTAWISPLSTECIVLVWFKN